ncbi:hypothetical protein SYJ56_15620 [Algoriphagus sp. D3-2-R+10]|uniref:hypothetical protein n=1 Tax=Algoriphagus aurantiacus TaxID=3103948 RepID=UPI002B3B33FE|nr:hypothetical protein [Algoriphagus sp. D3-2-R+10]MEB2776754.1 hypothetical protein [Algoriphagus sp. D3-2-R+10]
MNWLKINAEVDSLNPGKGWAGRLHRIEDVPIWIYLVFIVFLLTIIVLVWMKFRSDKKAQRTFNEQAFLKEFLGLKKTKK